jgi:hypothetical protein
MQFVFPTTRTRHYRFPTHANAKQCISQGAACKRSKWVRCWARSLRDTLPLD